MKHKEQEHRDVSCEVRDGGWWSDSPSSMTTHMPDAVANTMQCEEKSQRCVDKPCSLRELTEAREGSVHCV